MSGPRILIAGGGPAALETALTLRAHLGADAEITLISPDSHYTERPLVVEAPFGVGGVVRYDLAGLGREGGFDVRRTRLLAVDTGAQTASTSGGLMGYDALVLAVGALPVVAVPGALTFDGPRALAGIAGALRELGNRGGGRAAYVVPPGVWSLPAYELALLTQAWSAGRDLSVEVVVVTAERAPLEAMGEIAARRLADELAACEITVLTSTVCEGYEWSWLRHAGGSLTADVAVALPELVGPRVPGIVHDADGFAVVDALGRVEGAPDVYAVGDCADHAIKQGGLATQQADLAARAIAHRFGAWPVAPTAEPMVLRAKVLTGAETLWLTDGPWLGDQKIAGRSLAPFLHTHKYLREPSSAAA